MNIVRRIWSRGWGGKLVVIVGVFVVVVVVVYQIAVWSLARRLAAILEADRRAGLPTTIDEAYGQAVAESENAEGPLFEAARLAEAIQKQALREAFPEEGREPAPRRIRDLKFAAQLGRLAAASAGFDRAIAEAETRPRFIFSARFEDPRDVTRRFGNPWAYVLRAEAARALCEADAGKRDAATERMIRLYQFARRAYGAAPFFEWWNIVNNVIRDDVHWAISRVLISGDIADKTRDALDEALALAEDNVRSAARAQQGQKLFVLSNYQTWGETQEAMTTWSRLGVIDLSNRIEIGETMTRFAPREPSTGKSALVERQLLIKERQQLMRSPVYRNLFAPAFIATINETGSCYIPFREIAVARCLRVLNALQRRKSSDADVAKLGLPREATIDPFTEEPLRVIKTKTGWVVYSLGEDQKEIAPDEVAKGRYVVGKVEELPKRAK